ncbi:MAG: hypothetical protein MJ068_00870 [Clostridia bacterium]|nr:hypothetical protein [Clostridia bacterium]
MTNTFAYASAKVLNRHKDEQEIALILKDIDNAKQGVMTFSKEVKKYMLQFIHKRYDNNEEVNGIIEVLKNWSKYESFAQFEIFQLQDECYFWYDFLHAYGVWKVIGMVYGFEDEEDALKVLIRLFKMDDSIFKEYPEI